MDIHHRRDAVEKCFDSLKNDVDMKRLYTHSDAAAEGKTFIAFLALIIQSYMRNCLQGLVKLIIFADHIRGHKLLNPPSKMLKDIFTSLNLDANTLTPV